MSAQLDQAAAVRMTFAIALRNLEAYRRLMLPGLDRHQLAELQIQADELAGAIDKRLSELATDPGPDTGLQR